MLGRHRVVASQQVKRCLWSYLLKGTAIPKMRASVLVQILKILNHTSLQNDQFGFSDGGLRKRISRRCELLDLVHDDELWIDAEERNAQSFQLDGVVFGHLLRSVVDFQVKFVDFCFVLFWCLRGVSKEYIEVIHDR